MKNGLNLFGTVSFLALLFILTFSTQGQSLKDWSNLESEAENLLKQHGSVGASIIIVNQDSVLFSKGFGHANLDHSGVTGSTLFAIGSITKTFTALGILKLVEEGKISLDEEVLNIAPELPITNKWADKFPVKVHHLLEHTSGFDELHLKDRSVPILDDEFPLLDGINIAKNSLKTRWKPGSRFAYSNAGYLVGGYLIEKVSRRSYNEYISKEVLEPLKMKNSSLRLKDIDQELLAKSFSYSGKELPYKHVIGRPSASLISSTDDMGRFLMMLLNKGEPILSEDTFGNFEKHHSIKVFEGTKNGFRLGIYPRFYKGTEWLGHGGSINKYNSEFEYSHELGIGIFVVSNGPNAVKTVNWILNAFHAEFPQNSKPQTVLEEVNRTSAKEALKGYYILTSPRNQLFYPFTELFTEGIFIDIDKGEMSISKINGKKSELIQTGDNSFSYSGSRNDYEYIFEKSDSIDLLYTSLGFQYKKVPFLLISGLAILLTASFLLICLSQISLMVRIVTLIKKKCTVLTPQLTLELGSSVLLIGLVLYLFVGTLENMHQPNFWSIALFLCTILFPLLTAVGIIQTLKHKFEHLSNRIWTIGLAASMTVVSTYLIFWDFFGFAIWVY
ncbi:serine hydrolase domain-containing protein [Algoriphagus sp. D3-2-R+10]|uniref:serine hydrolase domain-containing protein n=1 Tax=Algoriphagus aurantiacus TaxID=3103948 RepID=UPI002B37CD18|nr:serine hydrolase domain-containing protein [Algoriphagus sp. D3-2-R+10]MEB2774624.1 serine hydrolase domain-containing protein [Algoriphagus sp. D3-2-R+10]